MAVSGGTFPLKPQAWPSTSILGNKTLSRGTSLEPLLILPLHHLPANAFYDPEAMNE